MKITFDNILKKNKTVIVWCHRNHSSLVYQTIYERFGGVEVEQECLPDGRRMRIILKGLDFADVIGLYVHFDTVFGRKVTDDMRIINFYKEKINIKIRNRRAA